MKYVSRMLKGVLCGSLLMSFSLWAKVSIEQDNFETLYEISVDGVNTQSQDVDGKSYERLSITGVDGYNGVYHQKGLPELPVVRFFVLAEKEDIKVAIDQRRKITGLTKAPVYPAQESQSKSNTGKMPFEINKSFYQKNDFWPHLDYTIESAGMVKGQPQQLVTLFPVRYNPSTNSYFFRSNFRVTVENNLQDDDRASKTPLFAFIVGNAFKNDPAIADYKKFKESLGYEVKTIVVGEDATTFAQIRDDLKELYANPAYNLQYALIFGDSEHVPAKNATNLTLGVTDHYYETLDGEYDTDMNAPDIAVGRLTFKTAQEIRNIVDKLVKYQKGEFTDEKWLSQPSFLATDDKYTIAEGSHNYAIDTFLASRGYTGVFPNNPQVGGDKLYAITHKVTAAQTVSAIKAGRFIINYSGHGATTFWDAPRVRPEDVTSMNHSDALPFVVSNACITGQYTIPESFAETWIKHKNGAIAFWGSMDSSYWDEDDALEKQMFREIYAIGSKNIGVITQNSLKDVWRVYGGANRSKYYWETYHVFGDPSVELRTAKSAVLNVQGSFALPVGIASTTYTVIDQNSRPVAGANVSVVVSGKDYKKLYKTDGQGKFEVDLSQMNVADDVSLIIYGQNIRLTQKKITITSPDYGYLSVGGVKINGSADLVSFPSENISVTMTMTNVSSVGISSGALKLESVEGPAQLVAGNYLFGNIIGNSALNIPADQFKIKVSPTAKDADVIKLSFRWKTAENISDKFDVTLRVSRAEVEAAGSDFGNPALPMDGGIAPGKSGNLFVSVKNVGSQAITNARVEAVAGTCVAQVQGTNTIASLRPEQTLRLNDAFNITLNNSCQSGAKGNLTLKIKNSGLVAEELLTTQINFSVGEYGQINFSDEAIELPIIDKKTVNYQFQMNGITSMSQITVGLNILHTYIGDLVVKLISPTGVAATLHNRTGSSTDNIIKTYGVGGEEVKDFENYIGKTANGTWILEITDIATGDQGTLKGLSVNLLGLKN